MPEYSSTTITPSDGVQVPSMNGSTSGNFLLSALKSYILSEKGLANGLASLDGNGKLLSSQLPDLADDVIVVASYASLPATGTAGKLYITADTNKMYRWDPDLTTPDYVELSVDLSAYATKAELAAEESARESEDSNLKSAIQGNSQRIENLEVAVSGSLVQTNTDATMANTKTITNANEILPWAIMKRVGARSTLFNQRLTYGNFPNGQESSWNRNNGTIAFANGECMYTITAIAPNDYENRIFRSIGTPIQGHTYMLSGEVLAPNNNYFTLNCAGINIYTRPTPNSWTRLVGSGTPQNTNGNFFAFVDCTSNYAIGDVIKYRNLMIFDLTLMQEVSLTADQFRAKFPASYYPYNAVEIIPLNPSAFKVVGKNLVELDDTTVVGDSSTDGIYQTSDFPSSYQINTQYTLSFDIVSSNITYSDAGNLIFATVEYTDGTIGYGSEVTTSNYTGSRVSAPTAPSKTVKSIALYRHSRWTGGSIRISNIQLEKGSTATAYEEYKETTLDTSFTSDYKYVNENCYDYSENVLVNGVMRREEHKGIVGSYTFTGNENWTIGDGYVYTPVGEAILPQDAVLGSQCLTDVPNATATIANSGAKRVALTLDTTTFDTKAKVQALVTGRNLYYALASPSTPTLHDPIPNFPCEDGTTITAITPQTDLVNAIDVPTTIAYMTKISS